MGWYNQRFFGVSADIPPPTSDIFRSLGSQIHAHKCSCRVCTKHFHSWMKSKSNHETFCVYLPHRWKLAISWGEKRTSFCPSEIKTATPITHNSYFTIDPISSLLYSSLQIHQSAGMQFWSAITITILEWGWVASHWLLVLQEALTAKNIHCECLSISNRVRNS